jgi:hypothetical protein
VCRGKYYSLVESDLFSAAMLMTGIIDGTGHEHRHSLLMVVIPCTAADEAAVSPSDIGSHTRGAEWRGQN